MNILDKIKKMAMDIAPDYPNVSTAEPWEQLWAIRSSYEGCSLANGDCHKLINKLREKLGWTEKELIDFWIANR